MADRTDPGPGSGPGTSTTGTTGTTGTTTTTGAAGPAGATGTRAGRRAANRAALRARGADLAARAIALITTVVVAILAIYIVFVMFEANTSNGIVRTVGDWAQNLAWQFKDVFAPKDPKVAVLVNYGVAAIVYLIVGRLLARLVQRLGR